MIDDTVKLFKCEMSCKDYLLKHFLIVGLLSVITFGLVCPGPGQTLNQQKIGGMSMPDIAIDVIFVLSGIALDSVSDANRPKAFGIGLVLVLFVTPGLAPCILYLKTLFPSLNQQLLQGMALFTIVPTTLSSGVTMITMAKGNVSLAILLTSVTNIFGVFTMSWSASKVFASHVDIDPTEMLRELIFLTLVPLVFGMCLRRFVAPIRNFAKEWKKPIGLTQNSCILFVVFLMISKAAPSIFKAKSADLWLCLCLAAGVHLTYRLIGYVVATGASLPPAEWVTIVLMCSQKSLPVCVSILAALPQELRQDSGLFILPCIMAHAAQLIIDSILAVRWDTTKWDTTPKAAPLLG